MSKQNLYTSHLQTYSSHPWYL